MYSMPQVLQALRDSLARSSCICTMRFGFGCTSLCGLCALWLRSDSGCFAVVVDLTCFLKSEKTGLRFCSGGGELEGTGEDGGLDRGASDQIGGDDLGLDVGGSEAPFVGSFTVSGACRTVDIVSVVSVDCTAHSTRLRLVGGSSS